MASKPKAKKKAEDAAGAKGGFHALDLTKDKLWPDPIAKDETTAIGSPTYKSVKARQQGGKKTYSADEVEKIVAAAVATALEKASLTKEKELVIGGK
jgi:hypothetical protein